MCWRCWERASSAKFSRSVVGGSSPNCPAEIRVLLRLQTFLYDRAESNGRALRMSFSFVTVCSSNSRGEGINLGPDQLAIVPRTRFKRKHLQVQHKTTAEVMVLKVCKIAAVGSRRAAHVDAAKEADMLRRLRYRNILEMKGICIERSGSGVCSSLLRRRLFQNGTCTCWSTTATAEVSLVTSLTDPSTSPGSRD